MTTPKKISLITLGEELLLGITQNTHLTYIGDQFRQRGVTLRSALTISDESDAIDKQFRYIWENSDVVITTGGLGPTVDDRTKESIAAALGETLVFDSDILQSIEKRFKQMGKPMSENNRKQAYRPENAMAIENANGTAPGLWLEKNDKILIMLPGPPHELQAMFESQVIPRLERLGYVDQQANYLQMKTVGIGESALETQLQPVFAVHPDLAVAYCAHQGAVDCRISFPSADNRYETLLEIAEACKTLLGDDFLCLGHDSLAEVVSNILKARLNTLATAESCTGGLIANTFTDVPGASDFFLGSIVSYSINAKMDLLNVPEEMIQQHTAVSDEVAIAMASGVAERFEADYALSATGYAGPTGGTPENPVGTVYIGLHSPRGIWSRKLFWKGSRSTVKKRVVSAAMDMLRRELIAGKNGPEDANRDLREESNNILKSLS